jgi:anti-sigma28 factor (negative regulator of flagellin synthesis)
MSLRIQNDPATNGTAAEVSHAAQSSSVSPGLGKAQKTTGSAGGDQVDVSSVTEAISAGISAQNLQRATRVTQLGALYAKGQYSVDSAHLSSAIVGNAITGSAAAQT